jgi:4-hydroxy-tetrahydrodipicolinate reductase
MIPIVLIGAAGRMGRAIDEAARQAGGFEMRARVDPGAAEAAGFIGDASAAIRAGDVVIEFSTPEGTRSAAELCATRGAALVSGTTGLSAADEAALRAAATRVAVLRSPNFSLGIAALQRALETVLNALPRSWDVEIVERHHRRKADSPSGTALALAHCVVALRGLGEGVLTHGRSGRVGERPRDQIGVHAVRGGSWVGDHAVLIAGEGEWIELRHVAQDRAAFAAGALAAAQFVARARPGLYTLGDALGPR